jgi:peptidoglycan hydrolase-like protein with peptidoglycan-binding domain
MLTELLFPIPVAADVARRACGDAERDAVQLLFGAASGAVAAAVIAASQDQDHSETAPLAASVHDSQTASLVPNSHDGPDVEAIQYLLRQHGQDVDVDGEFGPQTMEAVVAFQCSKELSGNGIVGPDTWAALWVEVRKGSPQDDAVSAAQTLLQWHGKDIDVDGDFGDQMEAAVRSFQSSNKLAVNGVVGNETWKALIQAP